MDTSHESSAASSKMFRILLLVLICYCSFGSYTAALFLGWWQFPVTRNPCVTALVQFSLLIQFSSDGIYDIMRSTPSLRRGQDDVSHDPNPPHLFQEYRCSLSWFSPWSFKECRWRNRGNFRSVGGVFVIIIAMVFWGVYQDSRRRLSWLSPSPFEENKWRWSWLWPWSFHESRRRFFVTMTMIISGV